MRLRFAEPSHLIDISHIPGLDYIREESGFLKLVQWPVKWFLKICPGLQNVIRC